MALDYLTGLAIAAALILLLLWLALGKRGKARDFRDRIFLPKEMAKGKRAGAPISGDCAFCGERASMPFKCKFCGRIHCGKHRLPESHNCPGLARLRRGL
jgi:predicted nucleic acid binding AN1-type Zn finger protein